MTSFHRRQWQLTRYVGTWKPQMHGGECTLSSSSICVFLSISDLFFSSFSSSSFFSFKSFGKQSKKNKKCRILFVRYFYHRDCFARRKYKQKPIQRRMILCVLYFAFIVLQVIKHKQTVPNLTTKQTCYFSVPSYLKGQTWVVLNLERILQISPLSSKDKKKSRTLQLWKTL